jgi:hypothetical protein
MVPGGRPVSETRSVGRWGQAGRTSSIRPQTLVFVMDSQWLEDCARRGSARSRRRGTSYGVAIPSAVALLAVLLFLVPDGWVRWLFHRTFALPPGEVALTPVLDGAGPIRLIPAEMLPPSPSARARAREQDSVTREVLVEEAKVDTSGEGKPEPKLSPWSWDPTTGYAVTRELTASGHAQTDADSVLRHAVFLRSLRLTDLDPALAMLDTTQSARAREQFHAVDRWYFRNWAPLWKAQGAAARLADIYERAVLEAERDKGM